MSTPAYTEFDSNKPDGTAGTGTTFSADTLAQVRALRDGVISGRIKGFVQTRTQGTGPGTDRPQLLAWTNATTLVGFRMNITWNTFQLAQVQWEWSNDNGATWAVMGGAEALTYDAFNNITASTNSGGFVNILFEVWTKLLKGLFDLATHVSSTGTSVHGLGSMSTQGANAVNITGGSINGVNQGATTPGDLDCTRVREAFHDYGAQGNGATVTLEWDKYGHVSFTPDATTTSTLAIAFSGLPAAGRTQSIMVEIVNGRRSADGKITYPGNSKWVGGAAARPLDTALELAGRNLFVVTTRDGGARLEWQHVGKGG